MEFPRKYVYSSGYKFHFFDYGYRSLNSPDLLVSIIVKKDDKPICFRDIVVTDSDSPTTETDAFINAFTANPSQFINMDL